MGLAEATDSRELLPRARGPARPPDVAGRGPGVGHPRPGRCPRASTSTRTPHCWRWPAGRPGRSSRWPTPSHVSRTTMVKVAPQLADQGLVERVRNPDDRRSYALTRTLRARPRPGAGAGTPRTSRRRSPPVSRSPSARSCAGSAPPARRRAGPGHPRAAAGEPRLPHHPDPLPDAPRVLGGARAAGHRARALRAAQHARHDRPGAAGRDRPAAGHQRRQRRPAGRRPRGARAGRAPPAGEGPAHPGAAPPARRRGGRNEALQEARLRRATTTPDRLGPLQRSHGRPSRSSQVRRLGPAAAAVRHRRPSESAQGGTTSAARAG